MTDSAPKVLEGVFAISKPPSLSSAQVLRDLQTAFASSKTFAPLLEETRRKEEEQARHQQKRRRGNRDAPFKMGHGGTLDPLATGVLIVGIGRGTKHLQNFLGCTKVYETVVLFGKTTDTYDIAGKIVGEAEYKHVTKALVESKLDQFRGKIRQAPPVYSALKINGMKAYEYARAGMELPRELESREMQVEECTLLEWYNGGDHDFRWPAEEAPEDEKRAVSKLMGVTQSSTDVQDEQSQTNEQQINSSTSIEAQATVHPSTQPTTTPSISTEAQPDQNALPPASKSAMHTHDHTLSLSTTPAPSPAARIRLAVSSGFYVRSFAHDLGLTCDSAGIMASLIRSRQATYTVSSPAESPTLTSTLPYSDLSAGEEIWGPQITAQLEKWMDANPAADTGHVNGRDPATRDKIREERDGKPKQRFRGEWIADSKKERLAQQGGKWKGKWNQGGNRGKLHERAAGGGMPEKRARERNSSSPE